MSCTSGKRPAELSTAELEVTGGLSDSPTTTNGSTDSPVSTPPLQRIEHGLDAALEQMEEVSLALTETTSALLAVPLEQVALAARVGAVMSDLRVLRLSVGTLVLRERTLSPA